MTEDIFSIWVSVGLMLGFWAFAQVMIEVKPQRCPWEPAQELVPDTTNYEARNQRDWKESKLRFVERGSVHV